MRERMVVVTTRGPASVWCTCGKQLGRGVLVVSWWSVISRWSPRALSGWSPVRLLVVFLVSRRLPGDLGMVLVVSCRSPQSFVGGRPGQNGRRDRQCGSGRPGGRGCNQECTDTPKRTPIVLRNPFEASSSRPARGPPSARAARRPQVR